MSAVRSVAPIVAGMMEVSVAAERNKQMATACTYCFRVATGVRGKRTQSPEKGVRMRKLPGYPVVLITGATLLLLSTSSFGQTQSKTQNVAVVNTPTVTIDSTVGVDVLSLPNQTLAVSATEGPTYWRARKGISAGDPAVEIGFTTDAPAGKRFVVKSIFISGKQNTATYVDKVMVWFPGGHMYLPVSKYPDQIVAMPDTTIAIPPGDLDIRINYVGANFAEPDLIDLLVTWYVVPRE